MADLERTRGKVADYYRGETVFITGFTGYLGKQLVEKLLWSCPEVRRIYALVRSKKGVEPQLRVKNVLESMAFDRLREHYPDRLEKVVGLAGDASQEGLGLESEEATRMVQETGVVFHCAACVRFDEPLTSATRTNLMGTQWALRLAASMPNLKSFNHVSTAYVNCDRRLMDEKLYPIKMPWRDLKKVVDRLDDATLDVLTTKMLGVLPNTYVFTKSLAEHMVVDEAAALGLPLVITRPSVVATAESEPCPGWVDSVYGPMGINLAVAVGVIRLLLITHPDTLVNYVYSDQVVRGTLAAPAFTEELVRGRENVEVPVYHLGSTEARVIKSFSNIKSLSMRTLKAAEDIANRWDMNTLRFTMVHSPWLYSVLVFVKHIPAALIVDALLKLVSRNPILTKLRRKMVVVQQTLQFFMMSTFQIDLTNYERLNEALKGDDDFYTDLNGELHFNEALGAAFTCATKSTVLQEIYGDPTKTRVYLKCLYYLDLIGELAILSTLGYLLFSFNIPLNILSYLKYFFTDLSFMYE